MRSLLRKARTFWRRPWFEKVWFLPAWILLGLCRLAILSVSFRRLAPLLGRHQGNAAWVPVLDAAAEGRALSIGRAVRLAARYTPWESNCFPQAVTARLLLGLNGIPYGLFFGVAPNKAGQGKTMDAHAWVAAGRVCVTGGYSFGRFGVVGVFVSPGLRA